MVLGAGGVEKGKRFNTENTEKSGEHRERRREPRLRQADGAEEGGRDPSPGMKQRRRTQDDDAGRMVRGAEGAGAAADDWEGRGEGAGSADGDVRDFHRFIILWWRAKCKR